MQPEREASSNGAMVVLVVREGLATEACKNKGVHPLSVWDFGLEQRADEVL